MAPSDQPEPNEITPVTNRTPDLNPRHPIPDPVGERIALDPGQFSELLRTIPREGPRRWEALTAIGTIGLAVVTIALILVTYSGVRNDAEDRLLPIVTLTSQDDFAVERNTIIIRNVGFGPALNTYTHPFKVGSGTIQLDHRQAIAAGESQDISALEQTDHGKDRLWEDAPFKTPSPTLGMTKRVTDVGKIRNVLKKADNKAVCISYENTRSEKYETWQRIYLIEDQSDIAIEYVCQRKTPQPCTQEFTPQFEVACRSGKGHE
jgi:hypothetical protein